MINVEQTIINQYADSPTLVQLIQNMNAYIDPSANFDAFYDLIWNIDTAVGYGLDLWGRIVGVSRVLQVQNTEFFGFAEALPGAEPFDQAPFYDGSALTSNFALLDNDFRTLIFAKALSNICDGGVPAINQILLNLFPGRGNCYCTDELDMTMTYTFQFLLTDVEAAIIGQTGILPKTTGVSATVVQI